MKQTKKLKDIAIISAGQSAPQGKNNYSSEGIPFVKAGNLVELIDGAAESSIQKVSEMVAKEHKLKLYQPGTVLFAKSGMSCMKGYVYQLKSPCYVVSHLACITVTEISGEYLKYYFEYHRPSSLVKDEAYPSISLVDIGDMEISYGNRQEQKEAVIFLNAIQKIIKQRREEIKKLDDLVKSQFIEMFGNPISNERKWELCPLEAVGDVGSSKRIFEREYVKEGIPFFRTKEVVELSKGAQISTELFISEERFAELKKEWGCPRKGDLLISAVGTIGVIWIVDDRSFYFKDGNLLQVRSELNSQFLKYVLEWLIADYKQEMSKGTAYAALTINALKKMKIINVPTSAQEWFSHFVEQTDKSKVLIREHLFLINRLRKVEKT